MDYFAGLDISMDETHICVLDREALLSMKARQRRRLRRSRTSWRKRGAVVGSYSRPDVWRRSCSTG
jgi:hypothetical protein